MGMVVRTNTMSTNAYRQLGMNNSAVSKSLEKLSSGFRINRAGDDASGLAISEKMKAQINGLEQASANSQDGISLIQTAEGATTEIHNMLNRMVTLATKSANGTIQNEVDREAIQTEVDALNTEITRIAKATNFNGIDLLNGNLSNGNVQASATVAGQALTGVKADATALTGKTAAIASTNTSGAFTYKAADGSTKTLVVSATAAATSATEFATKLNADSDFSAMYTAEKDATTNALVITAKKPGAAALSDVKSSFGDTAQTAGATNLTGTAGTAASATITPQTNMAAGDTVTIGGNTYTMAAATDADKGEFADAAGLIALAAADGYTVNAVNLNAGTTMTITRTDATAGKGLTLQVGDTNADFNHVTVSVDDLTAEGLKTAGLDVSTQEAAGKAIATIKTAINTVSTNRGNLGALQNRLEYTINNLDTTNENMTAANSRIRDTDMAKEMMNYTKMNILTQAAQAMLAQANQQPQQILQLLQ